MNAIIRLVCIKGDTGFKYRRFGSKGPEWTKISEHNGGEQSKKHEVKSTHDTRA